MYFLVFHGEERFKVDPNTDGATEGILPTKPQESPFVVWFPLVALAVPSVVLGLFIAEPIFSGAFLEGIVQDNREVMQAVYKDYDSIFGMVAHAFTTLPLYLTIAGVVGAWFVYTRRPDLEKKGFSFLERIGLMPLFENNYYFDKINQKVFAQGSINTGRLLWQKIDEGLIDRGLVFGFSRLASACGGIVRKIQTGYLYHSAFIMILGLLALMSWAVLFN